MAISKVIYKTSAEDTGTVWMDVTQKTVTAGSMLSGTTALKADGTDITGNIASKTSSDLTANVLTVTAPAGYYGLDATKTLTDANLLAENIKKDVTIFSVTGTYEGGGGGTSWETVYSGTVTPGNWGEDLYYIQITDFFVDNNPILNGDKYRVTWRNTAYECVAQEQLDYFDAGEAWVIGNATLGGGTTGNNEPFFAEQGNNNLIFATTDHGGSFTLVIEKQVSGGSTGLEYETGTYTPASDVSSVSISFLNTHTTRPFCVIIVDTTGTLADANSILMSGVLSWYDAFGSAFYTNASTQRYARALYDYKTSSGAMQSNTAITALTGSSTSSMPYWVTENGFYAYTEATTRYFYSGRTYKWIAVWKPTT